jgi:hypothetical protein
MRTKRSISNIYVFYRISDNGFKSKIKPSYITKYNCLKNALDTFNGDNVFFKVYIDAVIEDTDKIIHRLCDNRKNVETINIDTHSNGFSFRKVYEDACKLNDDDLVYFLEDDYLHLDNALDVLIDAARWNYTDYITLYDHADKYDNNNGAINPFSKDFGEQTKVFKTNTHHWKITNSTTMTFAAFADVLKRDKHIFWRYTETGYPYDFDIFKALSRENKLVSSPIPSLSTHGETMFLAPFIDWGGLIKEKESCCIVIITHKEQLNGDDEKSFLQALKVFGGKRDIRLVIPDNISTTYYEQYNDVIDLCKVPNERLSSIKAYNKFLCTSEFYGLFSDFDYILIYQTDCWVFEDRLDYFIEMGCDYYGAPWPHHNDTIGNGGFSLRKVSKMLEITNKYDYKGDSLLGNEDTWFCQTHKDDLNVCDLESGCNFSIEIANNHYLKKIDTTPMGFHGKGMIRFWDDDGTKFIEYKNKMLNR